MSGMSKTPPPVGGHIVIQENDPLINAHAIKNKTLGKITEGYLHLETQKGYASRVVRQQADVSSSDFSTYVHTEPEEAKTSKGAYARDALRVISYIGTAGILPGLAALGRYIFRSRNHFEEESSQLANPKMQRDGSSIDSSRNSGSSRASKDDSTKGIFSRGASPGSSQPSSPASSNTSSQTTSRSSSPTGTRPSKIATQKKQVLSLVNNDPKNQFKEVKRAFQDPKHPGWVGAILTNDNGKEYALVLHPASSVWHLVTPKPEGKESEYFNMAFLDGKPTVRLGNAEGVEGVKKTPHELLFENIQSILKTQS